ncbi:hypothetical protein AVEN_141851-1 [Araneus ventricosus]|uniref:Uncharacterized protein n=1 Tax=Araneus ventricosus TaxID=182803 RepID=A0A4Y2L2K6_ARAVE|nr:hypothetical protein AVEN_141851-1 [Araneus ventricosus]
MPEDEVIDDSFQPFLFEVWRWLPHVPRHCINILHGIVKCRANSTTIAIIVVRQVKSFEVGKVHVERRHSRSGVNKYGSLQGFQYSVFSSVRNRLSKGERKLCSNAGHRELFCESIGTELKKILLTCHKPKSIPL